VDSKSGFNWTLFCDFRIWCPVDFGLMFSHLPVLFPVPSPENSGGMVMKGRKKSMRTIREILRLYFEHDLSRRAIARACAVSPTTVGEHLERIRRTDLDWPAVASLDDSSLKTVLFPVDAVPLARKVMPDFDYLRAEMKRKGVTLQLLWEEYRAIHSDGYSRSQFFELYRRHGKTIEPVMRFEHKTGEKLFVDFSGDTPAYVDRETGELISVELFVAVIGASSRTFALAGCQPADTGLDQGTHRCFRVLRRCTGSHCPGST
jgi:hypothetical protein